MKDTRAALLEHLSSVVRTSRSRTRCEVQSGGRHHGASQHDAFRRHSGPGSATLMWVFVAPDVNCEVSTVSAASLQGNGHHRVTMRSCALPQHSGSLGYEPRKCLSLPFVSLWGRRAQHTSPDLGGTSKHFRSRVAVTNETDTAKIDEDFTCGAKDRIQFQYLGRADAPSREELTSCFSRVVSGLSRLSAFGEGCSWVLTVSWTGRQWVQLTARQVGAVLCFFVSERACATMRGVHPSVYINEAAVEKNTVLFEFGTENSELSVRGCKSKILAIGVLSTPCWFCRLARPHGVTWAGLCFIPSLISAYMSFAGKLSC